MAPRLRLSGPLSGDDPELGPWGLAEQPAAGLAPQGDDGAGAPDGWTAVGTDKPCTGCGHCCKQLPCGLAPGNPCAALYYRDGRYWCALVDNPGARDELLIGRGCGATMVPSRFRSCDG